MMAYALGSSVSFMAATVYQISLPAASECGVALVGMAEEVWRMLPPAQGRHASFSETRMNGAKQLSFCEAVARAPLIGVYKTREGAVSSKSKLGSPPRGGDGEESAFPQQQPIFTGGKLPLKPSLLLEVAFCRARQSISLVLVRRNAKFGIIRHQ